jgi:hypothetical protein
MTCVPCLHAASPAKEAQRIASRSTLRLVIFISSKIVAGPLLGHRQQALRVASGVVAPALRLWRPGNAISHCEQGLAPTRQTEFVHSTGPASRRRSALKPPSLIQA